MPPSLKKKTPPHTPRKGGGQATNRSWRADAKDPAANTESPAAKATTVEKERIHQTKTCSHRTARNRHHGQSCPRHVAAKGNSPTITPWTLPQSVRQRQNTSAAHRESPPKNITKGSHHCSPSHSPSQHGQMAEPDVRKTFQSHAGSRRKLHAA